jgi:hypothetical protein
VNAVFNWRLALALSLNLTVWLIIIAVIFHSHR